jgi:hypothetical protein
MADDDDDDDDAAVAERVPVAGPITCSKLDGQVGDEGTKTGARTWQGISGVWVSTTTEGTKVNYWYLRIDKSRVN